VSAALPDDPFTRNVRALFLGGAGTGAVRAVRRILLGRLLGPAAYGILEICLFASRTVATLARLGLSEATVRFTAEMDAAGARAFARRAALLVALFAALLAPLGLLAVLELGLLRETPDAPTLLAALAFAAVFPVAVGEIGRSFFQGRQDFETATRIQFFTTAGAFVLELAALAAGLGLPGILAAGLAAAAGGAAAYLLAARRGGVPTARRTARFDRKVRRYCAVRFLFSVLYLVVWSRSETFLLAASRPAAELAYYTIPFALVAAVFELVPGSISALLPAAYPRRRAIGGEDAARALYRESTFEMAAIGLPIAAIGIVAAEPLVRVFLGDAYLPAVPILRVLCATASLSMIASSASHLLLSSDRAGWMLGIAGTAAATNVALAVAWIPAGGAIAAAHANAVGQLLEGGLVVGAAALLFRAHPPLLRCLRLVPPLAIAVAGGTALDRATDSDPLAALVLVPTATAALYVLTAWTTGVLRAPEWRRFAAFVPSFGRGAAPTGSAP